MVGKNLEQIFQIFQVKGDRIFKRHRNLLGANHRCTPHISEDCHWAVNQQFLGKNWVFIKNGLSDKGMNKFFAVQITTQALDGVYVVEQVGSVLPLQKAFQFGRNDFLQFHALDVANNRFCIAVWVNEGFCLKWKHGAVESGEIYRYPDFDVIGITIKILEVDADVINFQIFDEAVPLMIPLSNFVFAG